jgi:alcohol dehydrogenase
MDERRTTRGAVLERLGAMPPYAHSAPLTIAEVQLDEPGRGELLVRIEAAGVCHSDLSVVQGLRTRPVPMLLGHEAAGIVESVGESVESIRPGQRVVMTFLPRCGECSACETDGRLPCIPGSAANAEGALLQGGRRLSRDGEAIHHHLGVSGFAEHAIVDQRSVVPVDHDVPPEIAALLGCAVLTGGGAVLNVGQPADGEAVAIVGLGGVGMAALLVAVALGRGEVIGIDTNADKLRIAERAGATRVMTPDEALELGIRADVVVECAGHARAFETAFSVTSPGGRTVTVGLPGPDQSSAVSPLVLTVEARSIIGSYMGSAVPSRDIPKFVAMWREGRLPLETLTSSTIGLGQVNEAMDHLAAGQALRQVILFQDAA